MENIIEFKDMTPEEKKEDMRKIVETFLKFGIIRKESLGTEKELMEIYEKSQGELIRISEIITRNGVIKMMRMAEQQQ